MVEPGHDAPPLTRRQIREAERAAAERAQRSAAHLAPERGAQPPAHPAWAPRLASSASASSVTASTTSRSVATPSPVSASAGVGRTALPGVPSGGFNHGPDARPAPRNGAPGDRSAAPRPSGSQPARTPSAPGQHTPSWVPAERLTVAHAPDTRPAATATLTPPHGAPSATDAAAPHVVVPAVPVAPAVFVPPAPAAADARVAETAAIAAPAAFQRTPAPAAPAAPLSDETVVLDAFVALDEPPVPVEAPAATATVQSAGGDEPNAPHLPSVEPRERHAESSRVVAVSGSEQRGTPEHVVRAQARALSRAGRNAVRFGVVGALAAVTVAVPLGRGTLGSPDVLSGLPSDHGTLPTTVSALTAAPLSVAPPASLTTVDSAILDARGAELASRDASRQPLPGCDPSARPAGQNGRLAREDLCALWDGHTQMRADAASALAELNAVYVARFGADMCIASGYRTLQEQYSVKARKGGLAAPPGKSNHGWGLAIDFCSSMTTGARWTWLNENAGTYGFENPAWARPGGSGPYERWHWEYTKGVMADGEYYG